MNYLNTKHQGSNLKDAIAALNFIINPAGYNIDTDEENKTISIRDLDGKQINNTNYIYKDGIGNFRCEVDNNRIMEFNFYNNANRLYLLIEDPNIGLFEINLDFVTIWPSNLVSTHDSTSTNKPYFTENGRIYVDFPTVYVENVLINFPNVEYSISYSLYNNITSFSKTIDESSAYCDNIKVYEIAISRETNNSSFISFSKMDDDNVKSIETYGYEGAHELGYQIGLNERGAQFSTYYHEVRCDGTRIDIDHCYNEAFKHYTNEKLINNENVRDILDEIILKYELLFKYDDYKTGIIGGRLFDAYKNGVPNNSRVANNMLEAVGIPIKKDKGPKKRSK